MSEELNCSDGAKMLIERNQHACQRNETKCHTSPTAAVCAVGVSKG